jgi:hypothetical protein
MGSLLSNMVCMKMIRCAAFRYVVWNQSTHNSSGTCYLSFQPLGYSNDMRTPSHLTSLSLSYTRRESLCMGEIQVCQCRCIHEGTLQPGLCRHQNHRCQSSIHTTGMVKDADGQRLRRRPNVGAVGVGYILGSPRSWPSA